MCRCASSVAMRQTFLYQNSMNISLMCDVLASLPRRCCGWAAWATEPSRRCRSVGLCRCRGVCSSGSLPSPSSETRSLTSERCWNAGCHRSKTETWIRKFKISVTCCTGLLCNIKVERETHFTERKITMLTFYTTPIIKIRERNCTERSF